MNLIYNRCYARSRHAHTSSELSSGAASRFALDTRVLGGEDGALLVEGPVTPLGVGELGSGASLEGWASGSVSLTGAASGINVQPSGPSPVPL